MSELPPQAPSPANDPTELPFGAFLIEHPELGEFDATLETTVPFANPMGIPYDSDEMGIINEKKQPKKKDDEEGGETVTWVRTPCFDSTTGELILDDTGGHD